MNSSRFFMALTLAGLLSISGRAFADDDATPKLPEPQAPKHVTVEDGRIETYIGTPLVAGYGIGDSIPVRLVFELMPDAMYNKLHNIQPPLVVPATPSLQTNLPAVPASTGPADQAKVQMPVMLDVPMIEVEGLQMAKQSGQVSKEPSDVEPLTQAKVEGPYLLKDGRRMVVVTMQVTQYVTTQKTQVDIVMDYQYAVSKLPDGRPDWHTASTPAMPVGIHTTATKNETTLIDGDLSPKVAPKAPAAYVLTFGGALFSLPMLVALIVLLFRRATRGRRLTKDQKLWVKLDQIFADGEALGTFSIERYQRVFYALRDHFEVLGMDTTAVLTALKLRTDIDTDAMEYVFNKETWFYDTHSVITDAEHKRLKAAIADLVPRQ